jgi:hypothetical protein
MSSNTKNRDEADSNFSFGVREMRRARAAAPLGLDTQPLGVISEDRGSDPYNTSGSFDRKKNWARVGKR